MKIVGNRLLIAIALLGGASDVMAVRKNAVHKKIIKKSQSKKKVTFKEAEIVVVDAQDNDLQRHCSDSLQGLIALSQVPTQSSFDIKFLDPECYPGLKNYITHLNDQIAKRRAKIAAESAVQSATL